MQNVPKIVRERLKAATSVANHPDADVLTAFAERSLPELERAIVLEHLARCDDCRDVLALALPASEPMQTVISPARGGWLTWPALRWGFVTAGIIAIAGVGFLQVQRRQDLHQKETARVEPYASPQQTQPASAAAAQQDIKDKSAQPAPSRASADKVGMRSREDKLAAPTPAPEPSPLPGVLAPVPLAAGVAGRGSIGSGATHNQFPHGPEQPTQWQQQNARVQVPSLAAPSAAAKQQSADLIANVKTPAAPQTVEAEASGAPTLNVEGQNLEARLQAQSNQPQGQPGYALAGPVDKAKPPVNVEAAATQTPVAGAPPQDLPRADNYGLNGRQLTTLAANSLPRWTITPTGGLQRSLDQGKTWQDVDVNASLAGSTNLTGANYTSAEVLNKDASANENNDNYAGKKTLKLTSATIVFRAVAAMGPEVWAGGSQGALYHSLDAGGHWTQVVPSADGAILTGDVVAIEFSDPQHGMIRTSTAETWTTSDHGQTWQKQ